MTKAILELYWAAPMYMLINWNSKNRTYHIFLTWVGIKLATYITTGLGFVIVTYQVTRFILGHIFFTPIYSEKRDFLEKVSIEMLKS